MSSTAMLWSVLFGSIGMGYFVYGKKQGNTVTLVVGLGLMVFPYFVTNILATVLVGVLLLAVPFIRL